MLLVDPLVLLLLLPPMFGHPPYEWPGVAGVDEDGGVVVDGLDAAAPAIAMPRPRERPTEPATTPAAKSGRVNLMRCSFHCTRATIGPLRTDRWSIRY